MSALPAGLVDIVGSDGVLHGEDAVPYAADATACRGLRGVADAVVLPENAQQVASVVRWCYDHDVAIVPRGGGSGLAGGAVPVTGGVVLSTERLVRVREIVPEQWRMTVEAGVTTAHVRRVALENGLVFPPDPGAGEQSMIGGNVATNAGGPHAFKYGTTGAWVLAVEAVMAPGVLAQFGGTVRKDVAGYDIRSLLVGSEGTLGVLTAVTLRLLPAPEARLALVAFFDDAAAGCAGLLDAIGSGCQPAALDFVDGAVLDDLGGGYPGTAPAGAGFSLLAELDGTPDDALRQVEELTEVLSATAMAIDLPEPTALWRWRDGVSTSVSTIRGGKVSEDIGVPVDRLLEALQRISAIASDHGLASRTWGHAGDGNVHASFLVDPRSEDELRRAAAAAQELFALAVEMGGTVTGEHGIGWLKRGQLSRQWDPYAVAVHEAIKRCLDPKGLFNPGKKG